jgi:hypothetical protein
MVRPRQQRAGAGVERNAPQLARQCSEGSGVDRRKHMIVHVGVVVHDGPVVTPSAFERLMNEPRCSMSSIEWMAGNAYFIRVLAVHGTCLNQWKTMWLDATAAERRCVAMRSRLTEPALTWSLQRRRPTAAGGQAASLPAGKICRDSFADPPRSGDSYPVLCNCRKGWRQIPCAARAGKLTGKPPGKFVSLAGNFLRMAALPLDPREVRHRLRSGADLVEELEPVHAHG